MLTGLIPALRVAHVGNVHRIAESCSRRQVARKLGIGARTEIIHAVAVDIAEPECRIIVIIVPALLIRKRRPLQGAAHAVSLGQMTNESFGCARTEVSLMIAVDICQTNRFVVLRLIPAFLIAPFRRRKERRKSVSLRQPALVTFHGSRTDIRFSVAVDIAHSDRRIILRFVPAQCIRHIAERNGGSPAVIDGRVAPESILEPGTHIIPAISVDIGKTYRRIVFGVVVSIRIRHRNRFGGLIEFFPIEHPALYAGIVAGAQIGAPIAVIIRKPNRPIIR